MEFRERRWYHGLIHGRIVLVWILLAAIATFVTVITVIPSQNASSSDGGSAGLSESEVEGMFHNYTQTFGKKYSDEDEERSRIASFKNSLKIIHRLNSGQPEHLLKNSGSVTDFAEETNNGIDEDVNYFVTWTEGMPKNQGVAKWGLTAFADLSPDEFKHRFLDSSLLTRIRKLHSSRSHHRHHFKHKDHGEDGDEEDEGHEHEHQRSKRSVLPDKVDWRDKKIISPIKHQKDCGACWAFSTVETVESMQALATGHLQELSVQQVIDCSKNGNSGCSGGDTCTAVAWMSNRKLSSEAQYPLTLKDGSCRLQSSAEGVQVARNYSCSRLIDDEDRMVELLATHGPVTVAVDATNWQYYVGGVIQWNCESSVNHAVQIVGYDKTTTPHHYIVRNSWGPTFGDNGYLYIATNKNLCGVATEVVWLSVE